MLSKLPKEKRKQVIAVVIIYVLLMALMVASTFAVINKIIMPSMHLIVVFSICAFNLGVLIWAFWRVWKEYKAQKQKQ